MTTETQTTPRKRKPRRTKMVAVQTMFHNNCIVQEGEVFIYEGALPSPEVCVKAPEGARVGVPLPAPIDQNPQDPPEWTTQGFVGRANRSAGSDEFEDD